MSHVFVLKDVSIVLLENETEPLIETMIFGVYIPLPPLSVLPFQFARGLSAL